MTHFRIIHLLTDPFLGDRIALGVVADGVGFIERPNVVAQLADEAQRSHARAVLLALRHGRSTPGCGRPAGGALRGCEARVASAAE